MQIKRDKYHKVKIINQTSNLSKTDLVIVKARNHLLTLIKAIKEFVDSWFKVKLYNTC